MPHLIPPDPDVNRDPSNPPAATAAASAVLTRTRVEADPVPQPPQCAPRSCSGHKLAGSRRQRRYANDTLGHRTHLQHGVVIFSPSEQG